MEFDARASREVARRAAAAQRDAARQQAIAESNAASRVTHPAVAAREADLIGDLAGLTTGDRAFIRAVTGEDIRAGQAPHDRPLSALAMQIASDRRFGALPSGAEITEDYLLATGEHLDDLGVPANPFRGRLLTQARAYLAEHRPAVTAPFATSRPIHARGS